MVSKAYTPKRTICKVTFEIPGDWAKESANLVGDFNDWNESEDPMSKNKKGNWEITKRLKPETTYRFRYFLDSSRWENDDAADQYVANDFGNDDSVVITGK